MTLTTEQLRERAKFWREKAVEAKWESVSIAQDMLQNADAFDELAANREAQPVALNGWRLTVTRTGDRQGVASISGPGVFCMEVPVEYSMLDFMEALAAAPAPANARAVAWEMRYWNSGYNIWGEWERITAEQHAEMSAEHATDNDYEFRALYAAPPAQAVPEEITEDEQEEAVSEGYVDSFRGGWNACRTAMLAQPVSQGYKLVPVEPTEEMLAAAMNCDDVEFNSDETFCVNFDNIYRAMLAAALEGGNDA